MSLIITSYHDMIFDHEKRKLAVNRASDVLERFPKEVGIVCTGLSGILVGVPVAEKTKREFAIVRKPAEVCHSFDEVEGYDFKDFVIVDDFISSGKTIVRILDCLPTRHCVGIILYNSPREDPEFTHCKNKNIPIFS